MTHRIVKFLTFLLVGVMSSSAFSYEKVSGYFVQSDSSENQSRFEFDFRGAIYEEDLNLITSKTVDLPKEEKEVYEFLRKVRLANISGNIKELLAVWDEHERESIEKVASEKGLLEKNKSTYLAMTSMRIKTVIDYGNYYIALVDQSIPSGSFVMKYPIVKRDDGLYLSNGLNGDPFFDFIVDQIVQEKILLKEENNK